MKEDYDFIIKKFNLSEEEFKNIIKAPRVEHSYYGTQVQLLQKYKFLNFLNKIKKRLISKIDH
jgi:hypothetical protein